MRVLDGSSEPVNVCPILMLRVLTITSHFQSGRIVAINANGSQDQTSQPTDIWRQTPRYPTPTLHDKYIIKADFTDSNSYPPQQKTQSRRNTTSHPRRLPCLCSDPAASYASLTINHNLHRHWRSSHRHSCSCNCTRHT